MMQFAPSAPAAGRATMPMADALAHMLIAIYSPRMAAEQPLAGPDVPAVARAVDDVSAVMMAALKEDRLAAYCSPVGHPLFYRIPNDYWCEPDADLSLTGQLFAFPSDNLVPAALNAAPVFVFADDVAAVAEETRFLRGKRTPAAPTPAAAWSQDKMASAIAACGFTNRDAAWKEYFAGRLAEHGWNNNAFRALWAEARGTKGMKGRPVRD